MEGRLIFQVVLFVALMVSARAQNDVPGTSTTTTDASTTLVVSTSTSSSSRTSASTTSRGSTSTTTHQTPMPPTPPPSTANPPTWTVESSNSTCILLRGNFTFSVTYQTTSGNTVSDKVDIPREAVASGSCTPFVNSLVLSWGRSNLTFMFIKKPIFNAGVDTGNGTYSLTTIFGRLALENPNGGGMSSNSTRGQTFYISVRQPGFMTTPLHNSYSCESYQSLAADKTGSVYLEMTAVQLEAFHDGPAQEFSLNQPCSQDTLSSVLPIVGYVLLAVVVGAAVGYFAWKKFSRSGYTEV